VSQKLGRYLARLIAVKAMGLPSQRGTAYTIKLYLVAERSFATEMLVLMISLSKECPW